MVTGAVAFAAYAHEVAKNYPVNIALHTDHCPKDKLDDFVRPLIAISKERVAARRGAAVPVAHVGRLRGAVGGEPGHRRRAARPRPPRRKIVLEIEVGVVGGEEDGVENAINDKLYTTVEDGLAMVEALGLGEKGRYMAALTFGNVHGVYKPGNVKLRPEILKEIQDAVGAKYGKEKPFDLVFHGGSGSLLSGDPRGARLRRGQDEHRHRHPVRLHPPGRRPHVPQLRRRAQDRRRGRQQEAVRPARLGQAAEAGMAARVVEACEHLRSTGTTLAK